MKTDHKVMQQALEALEQMYQRAASAEAQEIPTADLEAISLNAGVSEDIRCEAQEVVFIRNSITALREALAQPEQPVTDCHATGVCVQSGLYAKKPAQEPVANEIELHIIRKWPEGFQERLQHVWLDVVSFIPNVKLYDLQRVLAEFGFTMKIYEGAAPPQRPPLTDEQIEMLDCVPNVPGIQFGDVVKFARAIEAAHGIGG